MQNEWTRHAWIPVYGHDLARCRTDVDLTASDGQNQAGAARSGELLVMDAIVHALFVRVGGVVCPPVL
jgi:hypothetical protein